MKSVALLATAFVFSIGAAKAETTLGASYCALSFTSANIFQVVDPAINTSGMHIKTFMANGDNATLTLGVGPNSSSMRFIITKAQSAPANYQGDLYISAGNGLFAATSAGTQAMYMTYDIVGRAVNTNTSVCN